MITMNGPRLAISAAIGIAVSALTGLHAISAMATSTAPETAIALWPANGEAYEKLAFARFVEQAGDPANLQPAAQEVTDLALEALRRDPASAKSHALLALSNEDSERRNVIALAASQINRRDLTLQGLALEARLADGSYEPVLETLDQILRVHPPFRGEFYPLLGEALLDERTTPLFAELLDGTSLWHEGFIGTYALRRPPLLPALARLRLQRELLDDRFDRQLIAELVKAGEVESAAQVYALLNADQPTDLSGSGRLAWKADFPPFDWQFTDDGDFRAQESRDGAHLEVFARPGQGGIIAERILPVPAAPFTIRLTQKPETAARADAVRIELRCPGESAPFFAQDLGSGANTLSIENPPVCEQMQLGINARAFTGQQTLRTELGQITLAGSKPS